MNQAISELQQRDIGSGKQNLPQEIVGGLNRSDRISSFDLKQIPIPKGREEEWRFTPVRKIKHFLEPENYFTIDEKQVGKEESTTVSISQTNDILFELLAKDSPKIGRVGAPQDRAAVVGWNTFAASAYLSIPEEKEILNPIWIKVDSNSVKPTSSHIFIEAGRFSKATVLLYHTGECNLNETVEISIGDEAKLTVVSIQDFGLDSHFFSNHRLTAGQNSTVEHTVVTLGGAFARICVDSNFSGPGANLNLEGIYFVDAKEHIEHRVFVDHNQPKCYSRVTYKGALQGKDAHAVWIGDCLIGPNADGTNTYELNRNLVLTKETKCDSVPNLEIENGEIEGAGHASATGRFDEEQLFYLMSRGISEVDARRLVLRGFFAELVEKINPPEFASYLMSKIESRLEGKHDELEFTPDVVLTKLWE